MRTPSIQVESVAFDIDYRSKISRATFEEALADLKPTFTRPITDALDRVGLTLVSSKSSLSTHLDDLLLCRTTSLLLFSLAEVHELLLFNKLSELLLASELTLPYMGKNVLEMTMHYASAKIAQNVNADEAAVLGKYDEREIRWASQVSCRSRVLWGLNKQSVQDQEHQSARCGTIRRTSLVYCRIKTNRYVCFCCCRYLDLSQTILQCQMLARAPSVPFYSLLAPSMAPRRPSL